MVSIDTIILAGTKGCSKINTAQGSDYKQFLKIQGKTVLEYVTEAALGCPDVGRIYVVTDTDKAGNAFFDSDIDYCVLPAERPGKINLVPEYGDFISNIKKTFEDHVLGDSVDHRCSTELYPNLYPEDREVMILYSDMPLIRSADISRAINMTDRNADFTVCFSDWESILKLEEMSETQLALPETKTAFFPFEDTKIRTNNILFGKPLRATDDMWKLGQELYTRRYLLSDDGEETTNWKSMSQPLLDYAKSHGRYQTFKGLARGLMHFSAMHLAYNTKNPFWRLMLDRGDFEKAVREFTGMDARMAIFDSARAALDIDNELMYEKLTENNGRLFTTLKDNMQESEVLELMDAKPATGNAQIKEKKRKGPGDSSAPMLLGI
ncbi:NTP transferase domain-containing protein [Candidatus Woesearchaeota archaeon]|nr:NTP transferase domain-containing protein [Candidatus Woesearchaeota archaeon]